MSFGFAVFYKDVNERRPHFHQLNSRPQTFPQNKSSTSNMQPSTHNNVKPSLFFGGNAEEVVKYYTSIFPGSTVGRTVTYPDWGAEHHGYKGGDAMSIEFSLLNGKIPMQAVNGPPNMFKFTEAVSFVVETDGQEETDYYWNKLTEGADQEKQFCCWCQDKFGVWWQVVPNMYFEIMYHTDDVEKRGKAMEISMKWKKADLAELDREMKLIDEKRKA